MKKEQKSIKGTAKIFDDESIEFLPQQKGTPVIKPAWEKFDRRILVV